MKIKFAVIVFLLIFGVILCTCEINKDEINAMSDLIVNARGSSEGISLYFSDIPEDAANLWVQVYLKIPANDMLSSAAYIQGNELEQLRKTRRLVCPFVKNRYEYTIMVTSVSENENYKFFITTTIANGGIYLINKPSIFWNNDNSVTLSTKPEFSKNVFDSQNYTFGYGAFIRVENGGIGNRSYSNELIFDVSQMVNEISKVNGLTGDLTAFADISVTLEYERIQWLVFFATTEDVTVSF